MSFASAKSTAVFFDGHDLSAYLNSADIDEKLAALDTTTFGKKSKTYVAGLEDATASLGGLFDGAAGAIDDVLNTAMGGTNPFVTLAFLGADTQGYVARIFKARATDHKTTSAVADVVKTTASIQVDGGSYSGVILLPFGAVTATGDGAVLDNTTSTDNGAIANLHVTAISGTSTPTITAIVQHSADNSAWADLITFTDVTAIGAQQLTSTGTVNRYLRVAYTVSGTTPSFTLVVALARK